MKKILWFVISIVFLTLSSPADAQQPAKLRRIGFLAGASSIHPAFLQGLHDLGYVEGKNIVIEPRYAEGNLDRLPELAGELVRLKVDMIVTQGTPAAQAAKKATSTIPIVMATSGDPVGAGLVASLARPGGNVTGLSVMAPDLTGKQLQLLKEAVPKVSRVAILFNPTNLATVLIVKEAQVAAPPLGLTVQ